MTDAISDMYDDRIRCPYCSSKFRPHKVKIVNNRRCCPHCDKLIDNKIVLHKKVMTTYIEEISLYDINRNGEPQRKITELIKKGYKVVGYK